MTPQEALQKYFGYSAFRFAQKEVIDSVLARKDTVVIMPTGGGKSLCFQIPALCLPGITIVVSPLIALMKDQVDTLTRNNIPATFINSSLTPGEISQRLTEVREGRCKLVYIAPERFNDQSFIENLGSIKVDLFAIDEAHCISEWGHDFRPSYTRLKNAIVKLGRPTVVALTATATPEVREDIIRQLDLTEYELFVTGFDRPNLEFKVELASKQEKLYKLLEFVKGQSGSGIVYAGTRNNADDIAQILTLHDINAINYHAGLSADERKDIQERFMNNGYDVIVATNAFGMGIDKSNIRYVIHYDMPGTMESYYQEAGRAGRDGLPSTCLLFYNPSDRYLREFFLKGDNPSKENIQEVYETLCKYPEEPVLMTYSEIKATLSDSVPEMTIGTAVGILNRAGYIELRGENQKEGFVKFTHAVSDILNALGNRAKNKVGVISHLFNIYGEELYNGLHTNIEPSIEKSEIKRDAFLRALNEMTKKGLIEYEPPFRGKEIIIKQRLRAGDLDIDWRSLESKLSRDMEKLNLMEGYVYHAGDKRDYILKYFGDRG